MSEIRHSPLWKQRQTSENQRPDDPCIANGVRLVWDAIEAAGFNVVTLNAMSGSGAQIRRVGRFVRAIVSKSSKRITWSPQYGEREQVEYTWFKYVTFIWDTTAEEIAAQLERAWREDN